MAEQNKTPEQLEQERIAADQTEQQRIANENAQQEAERVAAASQGPVTPPADPVPAPRPKTTDAPAPRAKSGSKTAADKAKEAEQDGDKTATQRAEQDGTVSPAGQAVSPGVQVANTVPQTRTAESAQPHALGMNPAVVESDPDQLVKVASAYLGADAARELGDRPNPPAYGSPEYDVWMFENRQQAKGMKPSSGKEPK
jgi:hypothetical protein